MAKVKTYFTKSGTQHDCRGPTICGRTGKVLISGGAPCPTHVLRYFQSIDLNICEGFGMSETTGPATCCNPTNRRVGTCGLRLGYSYGPELATQLRIDPATGELQMKGPHIFVGYLHEPEKTKATFTEDGWLKSGDQARLSKDGFLTITGRLKELIVTAGGENVPPLFIEVSHAASLPRHCPTPRRSSSR